MKSEDFQNECSKWLMKSKMKNCPVERFDFSKGNTKKSDFDLNKLKIYAILTN